MSKFTEDAELRERLPFKMQTCSRLFFVAAHLSG